MPVLFLFFCCCFVFVVVFLLPSQDFLITRILILFNGLTGALMLPAMLRFIKSGLIKNQKFYKFEKHLCFKKNRTSELIHICIFIFLINWILTYNYIHLMGQITHYCGPTWAHGPHIGRPCYTPITYTLYIFWFPHDKDLLA